MARTCPPPALREQILLPWLLPRLFPDLGGVVDADHPRAVREGPHAVRDALQRGDMPIRDIIARMRHDGCGGGPGGGMVYGIEATATGRCGGFVLVAG